MKTAIDAGFGGDEKDKDTANNFQNIAPIYPAQHDFENTTMSAPEEFYRAVVNHSTLGIYNTSLNGTITFVNQKLCDMLLYSREELIGRNLLDFVLLEDVETKIKSIEKLLANGQPFEAEIRFTTKDKKIVWTNTSVSLTYTKDNQPGFILAIVLDITERMQTERALRESEENYRQLFDSIDEGFCTIDIIFDEGGKAIDYEFLTVNNAFEKHTQIPNPVGKRMRDIIPNHDDIWFETYGNIVKTGKPLRFEDYSDSMDMYFDVYAFKVGKEDENHVGVLFNNVTERKKTERRKDEFIGIASHELKTPVTSIKIFSEVLKENFEKNKDEANIKLVDKLNNQVDRLTDLIRDLLDTTKISEGNIHLNKIEFDLQELITETIENLQRLTQKHTLKLNANSSRKVVADKERIGQVLTNLVSNAIKYSPDGGEINVVLEEEPDGVKIAIKDNGIGIPDDALPKIFERFFRVDNPKIQTYPGMGLGLYISNGIIKRHNGTITAESKQGKGTTFNIKLPY